MTSSTSPPFPFPQTKLKKKHHHYNVRHTRAPAAHRSRPSRALNASSSPQLSKHDRCTGAYPAANDSNRAWCCVRARAQCADAAISNEVGIGLTANTGPWRERGCRDSSGTRRCCELALLARKFGHSASLNLVSRIVHDSCGRRLGGPPLSSLRRSLRRRAPAAVVGY